MCIFWSKPLDLAKVDLTHLQRTTEHTGFQLFIWFWLTCVNCLILFSLSSAIEVFLLQSTIIILFCNNNNNLIIIIIVWVQLGVVMLERGDQRKALHNFELALQFDPRHRVRLSRRTFALRRYWICGNLKSLGLFQANIARQFNG